MSNTLSLIHRRLSCAQSRAALWMRSVSEGAIPQDTRQVLAVADLLCNRHIHLHTVAHAGGRKRISIPMPARLITMSRQRLLRLMIEAFTAAEVSWPIPDPRQYAAMLGALACSYAHESDLTAVALILRVAARLRIPHELLTQACFFLLDQQRSDGAFGLIPIPAAPTPNVAYVSAQIRTTVDILSAVDAYADSYTRRHQHQRKLLRLPTIQELR